MSLANPMNISGPNKDPNYIQPNTTSNSNPNVANFPVGYNVLNLTWPLPVYVQPNYPPPANHATPPLGDGNG